MKYLSFRNTSEEAAKVAAIYGVTPADVACPEIRDSTIIKFDKVKMLPLGSGRLALKPEYGKWCLLDDYETEMLESCRNGILFRNLSDCYGSRNKMLGNFITHLYRRCIISLDGKSALDKSYEEKLPLYKDSFIVVCQLTHRCNFRCSYCYKPYFKQATMPWSIVEAIINEIKLHLPQRVSLVFMGGEVLTEQSLLQKTIGAAKQACDEAGIDLTLYVQTNGSLVTCEMADFFRRYDVQVSVSIDGSAHLNDTNRKTDANKNTFLMIKRGIERLIAAGVFAGAITVVSQSNFRHPSEVITALERLGIIEGKFNRLRLEGLAAKSSRSMAISSSEYLSFMKTVVSLISRGSSFAEMNLISMAENLLSYERNYRCLRSCCGAGTSMVSVTPDGGIFPCDHMLDGRFRLGSLSEGDSMFHNGADKIVSQYGVNTPAMARNACAKCEWLRICEGGGCETNPDITGISSCEYFKNMYPYLIERMIESDSLRNALLPDSVLVEERLI